MFVPVAQLDVEKIAKNWEYKQQENTEGGNQGIFTETIEYISMLNFRLQFIFLR